MSRNKDIKRKIKLEMVKIIGLKLTMNNYKCTNAQRPILMIFDTFKILPWKSGPDYN